MLELNGNVLAETAVYARMHKRIPTTRPFGPHCPFAGWSKAGQFDDAMLSIAFDRHGAQGFHHSMAGADRQGIQIGIDAAHALWAEQAEIDIAHATGAADECISG